MLRHLIALVAVVIATAFAATNPLAAQVYPEDHSMAPGVYHSLGVPSTERAWNAEEYDAAIAVLDSIARVDPSQLPRFHSATSGALFAHLTSMASISGGIAGEGDEDATRLDSLVPVTEKLGAMLNVYANPATKGVILDDELAELFGFVLYTADTLTSLTTRLLTAAGQASMLRDTTDENMRQRRDGLATTAVGAIQTLGVVEPAKISPLRPAARRRLAGHLAESVPAFASLLTPGGRAQIRAQLASVIGVETDFEARGSLKKLDGALAETSVPATTRSKSASKSTKKTKRN
jgi:hypothetical protein